MLEEWARLHHEVHREIADGAVEDYARLEAEITRLVAEVERLKAAVAWCKKAIEDTCLEVMRHLEYTNQPRRGPMPIGGKASDEETNGV